ncbi:dihydrofolate reductase-like domain-containing protein [Cladorrhinum sp. PSN332]|nr:dihydrofolate reductase-like domain-containing protein [Cladorrhinum sp. PSN332]
MSRSSSLTFPPNLSTPLTPYLPAPKSPSSPDPLPFVTLTYASSLDSQLSLAPGVRTTLSGLLSKAMTHHLRTHHAAILIGVNTALADDPALNSRLENTPLSKQPRPIILDPRGRWGFTGESKVIRLASRREGKGPFVVVGEGIEVDEERKRVLEGVGGKYLKVKLGADGRFDWGDVLRLLKGEGLDSVMVEGGGEVINTLLGGEGNKYVDSVVVTIAPTWLGKGGVVVSPPREEGQKKQLRLKDVVWVPCGEDVVLCGRVEG